MFLHLPSGLDPGAAKLAALVYTTPFSRWRCGLGLTLHYRRQSSSSARTRAGASSRLPLHPDWARPAKAGESRWWIHLNPRHALFSTAVRVIQARRAFL